ncbi:MAG TPA: divergent PAP2 family protein, partial [Spirochaetia bacterium]|nr:divergent PAP2 family protein [Spirochaetia bacterium]
MLSHGAVGILSKALSSPVFLSALSSWFVAQVLKSCIMLVRNRPRTAKEIIIHILWSTGGMPSSHSAVVSSLATSAAFVEGPGSTLFFVT